MNNKLESYIKEVEQDILRRSQLKTEVGDILIVSDDKPYKIVEIGLEGEDEKPFGLLCMRTDSIQLWSKDTDFKIGDKLFNPNLTITSIIKKDTFKLLKTL